MTGTDVANGFGAAAERLETGREGPHDGIEATTAERTIGLGS
jgi:hypothetical protein